MWAVYILWVITLNWSYNLHIFSYSVGCLFVDDFPLLYKRYKFNYVPFAYYCFCFLCLRKSFPPNSPVIYEKDCAALFSSRSFIVSGLAFRSLIHLELIFVCDVRDYCDFIMCSCPAFPAPLIEETILLPLYVLDSFVIENSTVSVCIFLGSLLYFMVYVYLCQYHTALITVALQYILKSQCDSSSSVLSQDCFGYWTSIGIPTILKKILVLWKLSLVFW